ncbi:MAG: hypothetical protein IJD39_11945 [Clostridia bacterium]|nr:hypothetical protein [Clostridia bacterium]
MKLTFLGTAAAEMYPAPFCQCPHCTQARKEGGKNIRANSAALIDDDILLDMNVTSHYVAARLGISLAGVRHLLVTHPHTDHFEPDRLRWRRTTAKGVPPFDPAAGLWSARFTETPEMTIHGNAYVRERLDGVILPEVKATAEYDFHFELIEEGKWQDCGDFAFLPLRSNHGKQEGMAHTYLIRRGGKTLFYCTDCGGFDPDQLDILARQKIDLVVMEGTFGLGAYANEDAPLPTGKGHMNLKKNEVLRAFLLDHGCITPDTPCILTHLCPHYTPPHAQFEKIARQSGFGVAYDGLEIMIE